MVRAFIPLLLLIFFDPYLQLSGLADGKIFSAVAVSDDVVIPDQRALIHFTNGVQRLVIETRFTGTGTNFAWVIPLPAQPVIEQSTTGVFPTLEFLFRPRIRHDVTRYYVGMLIGTGMILLIAFAGRSASFILAILFVVLVLIGMLLPSLVKATAKASASGPSAAAVTVLNRQVVGVFETATIASRDPAALEDWLVANGFRLSTNSTPIIADYVRDDWVFVTAKVRKDDADTETGTVHPLSFTFATERPVYPLRLTGVDNGPLRVELYVFAPWRVKARHFRVEQCTRPSYPVPPEVYTYGIYWAHWKPETPTIIHPLLRQWTAGAPVATKLTATLTPDQMREDVWLQETSFRESRNRIYSRSGGLTVALNWGCGLFAVVLFAACVRGKIRRGNMEKLGRAVALSGLAGLVIAVVVYLALPTTKVRLVKGLRSLDAQHVLYSLAASVLVDPPMTAADIRQEIRRLLDDPPESNDGVQFVQRRGESGWANLLLGGSIREEDSPGNFTLREAGDQLEFLGYDSQGAPHSLQSYPLQQP